MNFHAHISTLENFQHAITVNDFFQLLGCPLVALLVVAQPDLCRYAAHAYQTSDDVNDAVQEALWIVYRRIEALRAFTSLSGWLFAIVRRECLRLARHFWEASSRLRAENERRLSQTPPLELSIDWPVLSSRFPNTTAKSCFSATWRRSRNDHCYESSADIGFVSKTLQGECSLRQI